MAKNTNMHKAKSAKNDEFYTQLVDIEKELRHYKEHFKGKTVYCNCDDPFQSNFFKYFAMNFNHLGLKKLISTTYKKYGQAYKIELTEVNDENLDGAVDLVDVEILLRDTKDIITFLEGDGDFRSEECVELLKEADIVVTNPPFSLFREYITQLVEYKKKFLIVGSLNAITYKDVFPLLKENKVWLGYARLKEFYTPDGTTKKLGNTIWYTNLKHSKKNEKLVLYKKYTPKEYHTYDNYDAINVDKVVDIPYDWDGVMGVPITFMNKYNPEQFEIIGLANDKREINDAFVQGSAVYLDEGHKKFVGMVLREKGKLRAPYARIIIKRKGEIE